MFGKGVVFVLLHIIVMMSHAAAGMHASGKQCSATCKQ
jgi:hypothetical protein